ncbi:RNA methyltransferase [Membranihabitans maritimus]|uniref:RNA methyltransferase n=1 Tax=Membranihabitans maritimus TaxID=2904244 RepID=UPI001F3C1A8F|nr:RNA methyltransferase [Membranihabitans maritimus]
MRKLKLDELNRISVDEFRSKDKNPVVVVLDNIRSGVNVGSFFRTCDAFLIEKLWLCGYTPCPPHKEIFKTAIGAHESVEWESMPQVGDCIEQLKSEGYYCVGIEQTDQSIELQSRTEVKCPTALVFGNEVSGISDNILDLLDEVWEIPQYGTKHSLNVSVSAGIIIWDVIKELLQARN